MSQDFVNALKQIKLDNENDANVATEQESLPTEDGSCCSSIVSCIQDSNTINKIISTISAFLTSSYDVLTILISIADVTTDVWVIYTFKKENRNTFFVISLIVMILAQIAYAVAFLIRIGPKTGSIERSACHVLIQFLIVLPFTPFMSLIFYYMSTVENNIILRILERYDYFDSGSGDNINTDKAPILVWLEKKLAKHIGFILESMFEALPQSIIQLVAIVYFQDTQIINVISICISLLSVATKTMVFSAAIDFRVFIFNWLSLVCVFFCLFLCLCSFFLKCFRFFLLLSCYLYFSVFYYVFSLFFVCHSVLLVVLLFIVLLFCCLYNTLI